MNLYKDIVASIPAAVIVLEKNFKIRYFNRAFRAYFPQAKRKGTLRDIIGCGEPLCPGGGKRCEFCPMRALFSEAVQNGGTAYRRLLLRNAEGESIPLRIKVLPLKNRLLGVVDGSTESEIAREMNSAKDIQQRLLPPAKGPGNVAYSFLFLPCREIGGDLPDVYETNGETAALLADVSGKGISAGMLSAFVKAGWNRSEPSPAKALRELNLKFQELNLDERSYVTAAAIKLEKKERRIRYCMAGHNAPLLLKSGDGVEEIMMSAPPVSNWMPDFGYEDRFLSYQNGDILVMLTDGVTECRNEKGEQFSLERVEAILQRSYSAEKFIQKLRAALEEFCGKADDDLTAIAFDL